MEKCYCGSGIEFSQCCEPVLVDVANAKTAEALMRSRYSAYVLKDYGHLYESLHPEHRKDYDEKATKQWAESASWLNFEVLNTIEGKETDEKGEVEFIVEFKVQNEKIKHHEKAAFLKEENNWYFVEGEPVKPKPVTVDKTAGRNEPCPCGSGQKYKKCCGK